MPTTGKRKCRNGHVTLLYHFNAIAKLDRRWWEKFAAERDRRYKEVGDARAEALQIKSAADAKALDLQAQNQAYKDEKANNLREQINSERGQYPTKDEMALQAEKFAALVKPIGEYVSSQQGRSGGLSQWIGYAFAALMALIAIAAILYK